MAKVARGEEAAARDGLGRFSDYHAVHCDDVAWLKIGQGHFLLGGNNLGHSAG
jgi:hypothetical protein